MLKSLPPAGNPISLTKAQNPEKVFRAAFGDRSVFLYGSGTMALAAALMAAKEVARERSPMSSPEVLLPAYACPDLVSAALYAGLKPILVDLAPDTPWMDLDRLREQINSNTVAVIAVHFLGIPERLAAIRQALEGSAALLIEDSAQLFPTKPTDGVWEGDLVTLSFGRGKPVSLLGGGAVLCRNETLAEHLPLVEEALLRFSPIESENPGTLYKTKVHVYNALLAPVAYGLLQFVPFLHLGETIYKPLKEMLPFDAERVRVLAANIDAYCARLRVQEDWLSTMLKGYDGSMISDLSAISGNRVELPLLRYPVLVRDQSLRNRLFDTLSRVGLGCSKMYPRPLPEIEGIANSLGEQGEFPQARRFANRLLTLPCHSGVGRDDVDDIKNYLQF